MTDMPENGHAHGMTRYLKRTLLCLLLLLSPVGAPAVGGLIRNSCPVDQRIAQPTGDLDLDYHACGLNQAVEHWYQDASEWPIMLFFLAWPLGLAWLFAALALPLAVMGFMLRAGWEALIERSERRALTE
jgi:hypothetical protein